MPAAHAGGHETTRSSRGVRGGEPQGAFLLRTVVPLFDEPAAWRVEGGASGSSGAGCSCGHELAEDGAAQVAREALADLALLRALEACGGSVARLTALYELLSADGAAG